MRRRTVLSLIVALGLAACVTRTVPEEAAPAGMSWGLDHADGEGAKLTFGQPSSDNLVLLMTCQPHSGRVEVILVGFETPANPSVVLRSGKTASRIGADRAPGMHGYDVVGETTTANTVLTRFAETGQLTIGVGARRVALPPADLRTSGAFVDGCKPAA